MYLRCILHVKQVYLMKGDIKADDCLVRLDPNKMNQLRKAKGLSRNEFCLKTLLNDRTVRKVFGGEPIRIDTALHALKALGIDNLESVLLGASDRQPELGEWQVEKVLSPWITASNGLQYRTHLLTHRFLPNTFGRGKCYDLAHLADADRARLRDHLMRHPQVCRRLQPHPHLPVNERMFPSENQEHWWVVDQWVPGRTLKEVLDDGPLAKNMLPRVLREIALGLKALHGAEIVRRELAPCNIVLRDSDESVLLTDFELSKLLDGSPTVSKDWPVDGYRAPEVGPEGVDKRADLYSWGRILIHAALGELPDQGCEGTAWNRLSLPKQLENVARRCVAVHRSKRPGSIDEVLAAMAGWQ